jgi:hypothetical protein
MREDGIGMSGEELVGLACSLSLALSKKYDEYDIRKIKFFLQALSSNLTIIELQNLNKK